MKDKSAETEKKIREYLQYLQKNCTFCNYTEWGFGAILFCQHAGMLDFDTIDRLREELCQEKPISER